MKFREYLEEKKIDISYVKKYFKKFGGSKSDFIDMLQSKAWTAKKDGKSLYAFDGLKTGDELEQMLIIADDDL